MNILSTAARLLLGLIFVVFGLNIFLNMGPLPPGLAGQYIVALAQSHILSVLGALQIAGGALLLINRYVPLGLVLLGPVVVNILLYHLLLNRNGISLAIVVTVLWFIVFYFYRRFFSGIFAQR
jgi:putative oxidoreductase